MNTRTIFFGSTNDSLLVLKKLVTSDIVAVVTQPPKPVGRTHTITPTPVETWAQAHKLTVLSFPAQPDKPSLYANPEQVKSTLSALKADLVISACYGQRIPAATIQKAQYGGLNVHPSLLPRWRGADPVPWAILSGDHQTGVSVVTLVEAFDAGTVIAQKKVSIAADATPDPLRTQLFTLGADLLTDTLPTYLSEKRTIHPKGRVETDQKAEPYARRFTGDDGFVPWPLLTQAMAGMDAPQTKRSGLTSLWADPLATVIDRMLRALTPWPGVWTTIHHNTEEKRVKILQAHLKENTLVIDTIQVEGKTPVAYQQFAAAYGPFPS